MTDELWRLAVTIILVNVVFWNHLMRISQIKKNLHCDWSSQYGPTMHITANPFLPTYENQFVAGPHVWESAVVLLLPCSFIIIHDIQSPIPFHTRWVGLLNIIIERERESSNLINRFSKQPSTAASRPIVKGQNIFYKYELFYITLLHITLKMC